MEEPKTRRETKKTSSEKGRKGEYSKKHIRLQEKRK